jgi:hypothetical protein
VSYPILPSLSRAPAFKSTRTVAKGATLSDPMESGYVATRPRFTRQRRTFGVTYDFLTGEDARVLDMFECFGVMGEAGAFYMPNLLPNGSFEIPDPMGGISGWTPAADPGWSVALGAPPSDGANAVAFVISAAATSTAQTGSVLSNNNFPALAGDVYQVNADASLVSTYAAAVALKFVLQLAYADGSTMTLTAPLLAVESSAYTEVTAALTIPASGTGATVCVATASFVATLITGTTDAGVTTSGSPSATILLDAVGLALITPQQAFGRMPGSSPLGSLVRFTKTPALRDAGWAGGQKRYACTFEISEV